MLITMAEGIFRHKRQITELSKQKQEEYIVSGFIYSFYSPHISLTFELLTPTRVSM